MNLKTLFAEGVADALGFVGGGWLGFFIGRQLGFDLFAPGYSAGSMLGILMCGLGGGLGIALARRLSKKFK